MPVSTYSITGMHCQSCVQKISAALRAVPGVVSARVSLVPPIAETEMERDVPIDTLAAAVRSAGDYTLGDRVPDSGPGAPSSPSQPWWHGEIDPAVASLGDATGAPKPSLYPLALIVGYIAGTSALIAFALPQQAHAPESALSAPAAHAFMNHFMAGFFLVFSFFKLLDLRGFVMAYAGYDLLARAWPGWGYIYPFIELALGAAYLMRWQPTITNAATLALMLFGSLGVLRALLRKSNIRCACLGTALNLPMTTVTLVEDLGMAAMAAAMLFMH